MFYVQVVDKAVMILTNDNLELACQVVEKTASDKAIREVDERLQVAYQVQCFFFLCKYNFSQVCNVHELACGTISPVCHP